MAFLQRVLKLQAALWAGLGVALAIAPGWLVSDATGASALDVWFRSMGVLALVVAMTMVLVAQRVTDVWWWAWAFALLDAGTATVVLLDAAFAGPGAGTWQPWVAGAVAVTFGALVLLGISAAGRERPIVP